MPVPFALVCELLEDSHKLCLARKSPNDVVKNWFTRNRTCVDAHDTNLVALLSTLLPEKRTDRVYFIKNNALEGIIGRALRLGTSRIAELARHRLPESGVDLADCVETVLKITVSERLVYMLLFDLSLLRRFSRMLCFPTIE